MYAGNSKHPLAMQHLQQGESIQGHSSSGGVPAAAAAAAAAVGLAQQGSQPHHGATLAAADGASVARVPLVRLAKHVRASAEGLLVDVGPLTQVCMKCVYECVL